MASESPGDGNGMAPLPRRKMSGKRIVMILLPLLLLGAGVGALHALGVTDKLMGSEQGSTGEAAASAPTTAPGAAPSMNLVAEFYDLPEIQTNLNSTGKRQNYVRAVLSLELQSAQDRSVIDKLMPRIIDNFQTYLRELRVDDLNGSAGSYRLREELLRRIRVIVHPVQVKDVLFRELIVQ